MQRGVGTERTVARGCLTRTPSGTLLHAGVETRVVGETPCTGPFIKKLFLSVLRDKVYIRQSTRPKNDPSPRGREGGSWGMDFVHEQ